MRFLLFVMIITTAVPAAAQQFDQRQADSLRQVLSKASDSRTRVEVEPVELDVSQGVSVGLMVNERITNCFKYAFDATIARPEIAVSFTIVEGMAHLVIKDNGVGFANPDEDNFGQGLRLVKGLVENIGGKVLIVCDEGTSARVRFSPKGPLSISPLQI